MLRVSIATTVTRICLKVTLHMHSPPDYTINEAANTNPAVHSCPLGYVITSQLY